MSSPESARADQETAIEPPGAFAGQSDPPQVTTRHLEPPVTGFAVPLPCPRNRMMPVVLIILLVGLGLGVALLAQSLGRLLPAIRAERIAAPPTVVEPDPPARDLIDDRRFAWHLGRTPKRATALHLARARALSQDGEHTKATVSFSEALKQLEGGEWHRAAFGLVESCMAGQAPEQAREVLARIDPQQLSPAERERALALLARFHARKALDSDGGASLRLDRPTGP